MRKIGIFLLLALIGLLNATEQNLIFNGDFRLGTAGFGAWRLLRPDTNPELQLPALRSEPGVLLLENPNGEYFQLIGKECMLPTGRKITFRSEFEGPAGGVLGFTMLCIKNNQYITHHKGVALSGKRQKVEISFFPVSGEIPYIMVIYPKGKEAPAGTFRFYSFTLGGERQAPLLAALQTEKKLYIPEEENTCRIRAEIANTTATPKSGTLTLEILDSARNEVTARQALPLTLPPRQFGAGFSGSSTEKRSLHRDGPMEQSAHSRRRCHVRLHREVPRSGDDPSGGNLLRIGRRGIHI